MPIQTNISIRRLVKDRKAFHVAGIELHAPVGWEGQSQSHKNQQEVCIGVVEKVGCDINDLKPKDTVVMAYLNGYDIELGANLFLYEQGQVLAKIEDGKLIGVCGYIVGFPITNEQAMEVGLIQKSSLFLGDWGQRRFVDNFGHAYFWSEREVHMVRSNLIGQQVLDLEDVGIEKSTLPRVMYFVDKESLVGIEVDGYFDFEHPDQNKYNPLELVSTDDAKKPKW